VGSFHSTFESVCKVAPALAAGCTVCSDSFTFESVCKVAPALAAGCTV